MSPLLPLLPLLLACHPKDGADTQGVDSDADTGSGVEVTFDAADRWSAEVDWEPMVAVDSGDNVYQITTRYRSAHTIAAFRHSSDGGTSWDADTQANPSGTDAYDPQVKVARETGCVFTAWLTDTWGTAVRSSCDGGSTWSDAVEVVDNRDWSTDHGWLAVSRDGADVYVGFSGDSGADTHERAYVVASHDGGASWESPWGVEPDGTHFWFVTGGAVADDGTVYFAAAKYSRNYRGVTDIQVWRSVDGGASFEVSTVDHSAAVPGCDDWSPSCTYGFFAPTVGLAVDSSGGVLIAYNAGSTDGEHQGMWASSSEGGELWDLWSEPRRIDDDDGDNAFASVAAGPTPGDFRVAWQANTASALGVWNTWYQRTEDAGASWLPTPARVSRGGPTVGYATEAGYAFPYGDYMAIDVDEAGVSHVIWGEGASAEGNGGTWFTRGG